MDFMADQLANGKSVRIMTILSNFNREGIGIGVDLSLPPLRVVRPLDPSSGKRSPGPFPNPPPHRMARKTHSYSRGQ
jgi:putative transposase